MLAGLFTEASQIQCKEMQFLMDTESVSHNGYTGFRSSGSGARLTGSINIPSENRSLMSFVYFSVYILIIFGFQKIIVG